MKKLNVKVYLKCLIALSWFALAVCCAIKLFGEDMFTILVEEGTFKEVCAYIDEHLWANYLVSAAHTMFFMHFFVLAIAQRRSFKSWEKALCCVTVLAGTAIKLWNVSWSFAYDVWQVILFPLLIVVREPKKILNIVFANVAVIVFQLISMYVKDTNVLEMYDSVLVSMVYGLDVLIMLILYYAYMNLNNLKKGGKANDQNVHMVSTRDVD